MNLIAILCVFETVASTTLFVLASAFSAHGQTSGPSARALPAWNDNSLIDIQKRDADPVRPGEVKVEFYGHDAFKITSPAGLIVLTDPWRNDPTGLYPKWFVNKFPALRAFVANN